MSVEELADAVYRGIDSIQQARQVGRPLPPRSAHVVTNAPTASPGQRRRAEVFLPHAKRMVTMKLNLTGQSVTSCEFSYTTVIRLTGGYELSIESDFVLSGSEWQTELSPGVNAASGSEALSALEKRTVTSSVTGDSGALLMTFNDGISLRVDSDEEFESWTLTGPGGLKVVCMPGGELAVWSAGQRE